MAELADALDLGSSGQPCRFKSCYPQRKDGMKACRLFLLLYYNCREFSQCYAVQ